MGLHRWIIGLNTGHDRSITILKNGEIFFHLAVERIDRRKGSPSPKIPLSELKFVLDRLDINIADIFGVGIAGVGIDIKSALPIFKEHIRDFFNNEDLPVIGCAHHRAHALSTLRTSNFTNALVLVADGGGESLGTQIEAESIYMAKNGKLITIDKRTQDHLCTAVLEPSFYCLPFIRQVDRGKQISLGFKYEQITYALGFGWGQAGKTMALAGFGKPLMEFKDIYFDGLNISVTIDLILDKIYQLYLESGRPYYEFIKYHSNDIASTIQEFTEYIVFKIVDYYTNTTGTRTICLAGGLFLNCVINHKILENGLADQIHIVPSAGDDGISIGAAYNADTYLNGSYKSNMRFSPFSGIKYEDVEIEAAINHFDLKSSKVDSDSLINIVVESLQNKGVIGILRGRSEMGPRALCHRSILTSAIDNNITDRINRYIKFRETFRPFAPVVTEEDQYKYFSLLQHSPYMLLAASVNPEYINLLPAITHVDGTARVQAVSESTDAFMHKLLTIYKQQSGHPVLLNTSFNLAGEPIVESPLDAISTFLRSDIDLLVLENWIIYKSEIRK